MMCSLHPLRSIKDSCSFNFLKETPIERRLSIEFDIDHTNTTHISAPGRMNLKFVAKVTEIYVRK